MASTMLIKGISKLCYFLAALLVNCTSVNLRWVIALEPW